MSYKGGYIDKSKLMSFQWMKSGKQDDKEVNFLSFGAIYNWIKGNLHHHISLISFNFTTPRYAT